MSNGNHRTRILVQVLLQPLDALGIEVVGRLVEQQNIGLLQQQTAQRHTTTLTTGEHPSLLILGRTTQSIHSLLQTVVNVPGIGRIDHILQLRLARHERIHLILILIILRQLELVVHLVILAQRVINLLHALHHDLLDRLVGVQLRLLRQIAHAVTRAEHHLPLETLVQAGNNLEQS